MENSNLPKLLAKSDLAARWGVTRQVVNNWSSRYPDFPPEFMRVDNGRMPLFAEEDVRKYETARKLRKLNGGDE